MAEANQAIDYMLRDEGGKFDPTGPSRWGVLLSEYQKRVPGATIDDIKNMTLGTASAYYQNFYWIPNFELIKDQGIANKIFSTFVNMGDDAIRFIQRALREHFKLAIVDDGVFGSKTVAAVNSINSGGVVESAALLQEFRAQQAKHYACWYANAPNERDYALLGLMRRVMR